MTIDFSQGNWLNRPRYARVTPQEVVITTEENTDLWQRSYYGFRNDNAPMLLSETARNFTFTACVTFQYWSLFDQCGLVIYLDRDNWFKASVEYENERFSRLGSVVTNHGYSDWATVDITTPAQLWYRLSRRGPDFLIESSPDGKAFTQMRIFHLHELGETTEEMGRHRSPPAGKTVPFGLYACSPGQSSFTAIFNSFQLTDSAWKAHEPD